jgi:hypothetical protein
MPHARSSCALADTNRAITARLLARIASSRLFGCASAHSRSVSTTPSISAAACIALSDSAMLPRSISEHLLAVLAALIMCGLAGVTDRLPPIAMAVSRIWSARRSRRSATAATVRVVMSVCP